MLLQFSTLLRLFLIFIIFFQMPKENIGLTSFVNKANVLGSPTTVEKRIKILTLILIFGYVCFAFELDTSI